MRKDVVVRRVRKWSGAAERARAIAEYRASGLTQREFARAAGVSVGTLHNWSRQEQCRAKAAPATFVEMAPLAPASFGGYKIRFGHGAVLEVPPGFAPAEVQTMLRLVREL